MPKKDPNKPPQFRGSDFAMRFEQGRWSEERIIESINNSNEYVAIPYGRSSIGPKDKDEIKEYWKKFCEVEGNFKRPDILVIPKDIYEKNKNAWKGILTDPTICPDKEMQPIINASVCGIEAENSLWIAKKMPDFNTKLPLSKMQIVAPRIWVKNEDVDSLKLWQDTFSKPIYVTQVFFDLAYIIPLDKILALIEPIKKATNRKDKIRLMKSSGVFINEQVYNDSRSGASKTKLVYTAHHTLATLFGEVKEKPTMHSEVIIEENGKIMPYVSFKGGRLKITRECINLFKKLKDESPSKKAKHS